MLKAIYLVISLLVVQCALAISHYEFILTESYESKDGSYKTHKLINGVSPGPIIIVDEDDWVEVKVINHLEQAAAIHFHGILQTGTPWSDGVPGITQRPIASGESYTYKFQVKNQSGCFWYHSHYRGYLSDGLYGVLYVRPKKERLRPYHLITSNETQFNMLMKLEKNPSFLIADESFKFPMDDVILRMNQYGIDPLCIQSILINGKGRLYCHDEKRFQQLARKNPFLQSIPYFDCFGCLRDNIGRHFKGRPLDLPGLEFPGYSAPCKATKSNLYTHFTNDMEWQYINVINAGGQYTKLFSIDDHEFYVVAIDGIFVWPQKVASVVLPVGSRFTICFETRHENHSNSDKPFIIRFAATHAPQFIEGLALLVYGSNETRRKHDFYEITGYDVESNGIQFIDLDGRALNKSHGLWPQQTRPFEQQHHLKADGASSVTYPFYLHRYDMVLFSMFEDGRLLPQKMERGTPLLESYYKGDGAALTKMETILKPPIQHGQVIDLIINNYKHINHPIHLHGHFVHVISFSDRENFPYDSIEEAISYNYSNLNLIDPPYLDVVLVPVAGHVVLRFQADNPGIWLLHCHNVGHLMGGMGAILLESLGNIPRTIST